MQRVGDSVRCPICQDVLPITESGNAISKRMLSEIAAQTQAGQSDAQIYAYFRERYGQRVLLRPSNDVAGTLLWAVPLLAFLLGAAVLSGYLRRAPARRAAPDPALNSGEPGDPYPEDPYLAEVRAEVQAQRRDRSGS